MNIQNKEMLVFPDLKYNLLKAVKKTGNTQQKKQLFLKLPEIINEMSLSLENNRYQPLTLSCFAVKDPKIREIFAPDYKDRVVHHLVIDGIEKMIDKKFIFDCYSNRKNKGTHMAVKRLKKFMNKDNDYYLKGDIKSFFPSIDKNVLWDLFKKHIESCKEIKQKEKQFILSISKKIIFQNPVSPPPLLTGNEKLLLLVPKEKSLFYAPTNKGLPIGSLSSQFFANIYLNELDQFIKHKLKIKYYIRYVDDFVIFGKSKKYLSKQRIEIENFIKEKLTLSLHPKKTFIRKKSEGIDFLGYIVKTKYLLVRKRTVKSFKRKLYFFNHLIKPEIFPIADYPMNLKISKACFKKELIPPIVPNLALLQKMLSVINSYYGIFRFADSYNLRKKLYERRFLHLKEYFLPKKDYKSIKINPAFLKDGAPKI
jgi:hypothetical protein